MYFWESSFENVFFEWAILKESNFEKVSESQHTLYNFLSFFVKNSLTSVCNSYSEKESLKIRKVVCKTGNCIVYMMHSSICSIIWPVWLNDWVFIYKLIGCGFESLAVT